MYFTRVTLALLTNIRIGWKGLKGTSTLAYYEYFLIRAVKCFTTSYIFVSLGYPCLSFCLSVYHLRPIIEKHSNLLLRSLLTNIRLS
jgi:hypothetical protein